MRKEMFPFGNIGLILIQHLVARQKKKKIGMCSAVQTRE